MLDLLKVSDLKQVRKQMKQVRREVETGKELDRIIETDETCKETPSWMKFWTVPRK